MVFSKGSCDRKSEPDTCKKSRTFGMSSNTCSTFKICETVLQPSSSQLIRKIISLVKSLRHFSSRLALGLPPKKKENRKILCKILLCLIDGTLPTIISEKENRLSSTQIVSLVGSLPLRVNGFYALHCLKSCIIFDPC